MADIEMTAAYASVVEDEDCLFVGFAEGEDEDEAYVLFRQPLGGGPVWFEATDESFGADDAIESVRLTDGAVEITLHADAAPRFGWARSILVRLGADCEDVGPAISALREMLGPRVQDITA